jgi:hypothetical protein
MTFQIKFYLYKKFNLWKENNMNSMNMPEKIKAKKRVVSSFCASILASLFLFVSTKLFNFGLDSNWYIYAITGFYFYFTFH